jgi:hypothetical protein
MSQSNIKDLRKQLKNVVKESLSDVLIEELRIALMKHIDARCDAISSHLKLVLESVEKRSKDISSSLLRMKAPDIQDLNS